MLHENVAAYDLANTELAFAVGTPWTMASFHGTV